VLTLENLTVRYGPITALRGLDLVCGPGELVTLVGANGAGKSSTLNAIAGALRPSCLKGRILYEGNDIAGLPAEDILRKGVALVPEGRRIFARLTVEQNLTLGATARRDRGEIRADLERELERFPILRQRFKRQAGLLSGGEQQQLAIARALLSRPKLLLLDEPSLGLAPLVVDEIFEVVKELRQEGLAIVLVEQNALRAVRLADRAYLLRNGVIEAAGADATRADMLAAYFGSGTTVAGENA